MIDEAATVTQGSASGPSTRPMVLLHVKVRVCTPGCRRMHLKALSPAAARPAPQNSEADQFLIEVPAQTPVAEAVRQVAQVYNLRHRIVRLKLEGGELAKYGPAKHPDQQGIDSYAEGAVERSAHYTMDPTGRRTGQGGCAGCLIDASSPWGWLEDACT